MLTDTAGFFDYCIPLTNESHPPAADSLKKYYDYSVYAYISPKPASKQLLQATSIFTHHNLRPAHSGPIAINRQTTDWVTLIFLACLVVFAWLQTVYRKRLSQIFRAVLQPHAVNQLEREGNLFRERVTLGLAFIYYLVTTTFIYQIFRELDVLPAGIGNLTLAGLIFTFLFVYQMLKTFLVYSSGIIFNTRDSARQYQLNILIFNHTIGIFLFPISIIAYYWNSPFFISAGVIFISLSVIYRTFRGILTGLDNKNYNLFYLFLYLCTLEILPLLLLYKAIS